jgi:hypothetical protein
MKRLPLVLVLSGLAGLAAAPAYAFDIEGQNATLEDGVSHFTSPVEDFIKSNGGARSLAMPLTGESDSSDTHISDYGNSISIPGPGIDAPGWSYSSTYYQKRGY